MATYKQTDIVTESKQRGGKRDNAGRKSKHGEPTAIIRLPVSVIEKIKQGSFENVTNSNSDKLIELEVKSLNCFKCVHWLDDSCRKGLTLSGWACDSVESWQAEIERLNAEITRLTSEETLHSTGFNNDLIIENKALKKLLAQIKHAADNKQSSVLIGLFNDNSSLFLSEPEPEKPLDREFTAAEKKQIRAMAKNQLENLKGNESVKDRQKLASLAGAFSKKLYLELYDLGYLERI